MTDELRVKMKLPDNGIEFEFSGTADGDKDWIRTTTETLITDSQKLREDDSIQGGYTTKPPKTENKLSA